MLLVLKLIDLPASVSVHVTCLSASSGCTSNVSTVAEQAVSSTAANAAVCLYIIVKPVKCGGNATLSWAAVCVNPLFYPQAFGVRFQG